MIEREKIIRTLILVLFLNCFLGTPVKAQSWQTEILETESEILTDKITKVEIVGNTVFSDSEIETVIAEYRDRTLKFVDLEEIIKKLTDLYTQKGYITSRAFVPQQTITNGVARIKILEGKLEKIEIKGRKNLQENLILSYFPKPNSLLNINELIRGLRKLERNSSIKKITGDLTKGSQVSMSVLVLEIEESSPFQATFGFNNSRSPRIGEYQGVFVGSYSNLLGIGDRWFGEYNLTEGFDAYSLGFSLPINVIDGMIEVEYRQGDSQIIQELLKEANIENKVDTISLRYQQVIVDNDQRTIVLEGRLERNKNETFLLGRPFSFTEGAEQGRSVSSTISFSADWTERGSTSIFSFSNQLVFGVDVLDATVNDDAPDGIFTIWRTNIQWIKALNQQGDLLLISRVSGQITRDTLLVIDKFRIGGIATVRGTEQNRFLGDNGVVANLQLNIPLWKSLENESRITLYPFIDWGLVSNNSDNDVNSLMSLGVGVNWQISQWGRLALVYGFPLIDENNDNSDSLQGSGFTFSIEISPF